MIPPSITNRVRPGRAWQLRNLKCHLAIPHVCLPSWPQISPSVPIEFRSDLDISTRLICWSSRDVSRPLRDPAQIVAAPQPRAPSRSQSHREPGRQAVVMLHCPLLKTYNAKQDSSTRPQVLRRNLDEGWTYSADEPRQHDDECGDGARHYQSQCHLRPTTKTHAEKCRAPYSHITNFRLITLSLFLTHACLLRPHNHQFSSPPHH